MSRKGVMYTENDMNVNEYARNDCKLARTTNTRKTSMSNWRNYSRIDEVLHEAERLTVLKHHGSRNPSRTRSRAPFNGENRFSNFPEASAHVVTMLNSLFTTAINILPQITIRSKSLFPLVQLYSISSFKIVSYDHVRTCLQENAPWSHTIDTCETFIDYRKNRVLRYTWLLSVLKSYLLVSFSFLYSFLFILFTFFCVLCEKNIIVMRICDEELIIRKLKSVRYNSIQLTVGNLKILF